MHTVVLVEPDEEAKVMEATSIEEYLKEHTPADNKIEYIPVPLACGLDSEDLYYIEFGDVPRVFPDENGKVSPNRGIHVYNDKTLINGVLWRTFIVAHKENGRLIGLSKREADDFCALFDKDSITFAHSLRFQL